MKIIAGVAALLALTAVCLITLAPRSLDCDVGLEDLTIRLERSWYSWAYTAVLHTSAERALAFGLSPSTPITPDVLPVIQAMLEELGTPVTATIGSREFRTMYCAVDE
jgi:hypothetical protein